MKKLLTAIATTAAVTLAGIIAAPAARAALPTFGEVLGDGVGDYYSDLQMLYNGQTDLSASEDEALTLTAEALANTLGGDANDMFFALLQDPSFRKLVRRR